jgi:hypothetical protein
MAATTASPEPATLPPLQPRAIPVVIYPRTGQQGLLFDL